MKKNFADGKLIVLLGAGASCDAGMKNSFQMIREIEKLLEVEWSQYKDLYNYIHSSHYHLERIKGTNGSEIFFNIENLVGLIDSIIKISKKEIDIYPFIGSWEKELHAVAGGSKLSLAQEFKEKILTQLKNKWLMPDDFRQTSSYYKNLMGTGYNYPLRIFSLNYDMCVEDNVNGEGIVLERGFNDKKEWDYRLYEPSEREVNYFLYKLHGSLDWKRDLENRLTYADSPTSVDPLNMEIIFGIQNKLQSYDPYLFYFYSFREACIDAELIVVSGYGFLDQHINDNLISSFRLDKQKKLLVNVYYDDKKDEEALRRKLINKIGVKEENLKIENKFAKDFFTENLNTDFFSTLFSEESDNEPI
ncbi:SIR2 family protein [Lacibacter sp.]|uniref:SIR2 family protein n=1 Tax=Lacibacter sp. TaxID=1915409 RepID=UPI002B4AE802|nr:SIR2 family protein [Lacibacter sp.]HLP37087.1 SIR2 family protein [Lacibacter sp.]